MAKQHGLGGALDNVAKHNHIKRLLYEVVGPALQRGFGRGNIAVGKWCAELGRPRLGVSQPAMMRLTAYDWPGNVRELINLMHRIVVTCNKTEIDLVDIPDDIRSNDNDGGGVGSFAGVGLDKLEKEAIRQTLALTQGNREQTAQMLGIGERTLYRKLKEYGLR